MRIERIKSCIRDGSYYIHFESAEQTKKIWSAFESAFGNIREIPSFKCIEIDHEAFLIRYFINESKFTFIEKKAFNEKLTTQILEIINESAKEVIHLDQWRNILNAS